MGVSDAEEKNPRSYLLVSCPPFPFDATQYSSPTLHATRSPYFSVSSVGQILFYGAMVVVVGGSTIIVIVMVPLTPLN